MKILIAALIILFSPRFCISAIVILKGGNKFEASKIIEEGDRLSIQTAYGNIYANKDDVENLAELGFKITPALRSPKTTSLEFISELQNDSSAGYGGGTAESERSATGPAFGNAEASSKENWTGLTWSVGPTFSIEYPGCIMEFGGRYTVFPELKDGEDFANIKWKPFSIRVSCLF